MLKRGAFAALLALLVLGSAACSGTSGEAPVAETAVAETPTSRAAAAGSSSGGTADPATLRAGPNVVLVTLDTLRADRLGIYGYEEIATPHLDRLGREGVLFEQAATTVPTTLPAHASIMTGQLPQRHGVRNNGTFTLAEDAVTLAEVLRDNGYETAGFVAAFVLDARFGIAQGFDRYTGFAREEAEVEATPFLKIQRPAGEVVAEAVDWIAGRTTPFFAWVHLYDPHTPYEPPEPFASAYADRPYDGEVAYTDDAVGDLVAGLEAAGHADDTLVVVVADHGEGLGDHDEEWHTFFIYDTTVRVPLMLWAGASLPAGTVVRGDVSVIDLLPTVLALLDIDDPDRGRRDGVDLRPQIVDPASAGRPAYAESLVPLLNFGFSELRAVRAGGWKYIQAPRPELYDLTGDPGETRNVLAAHGDRADALRATLDALIGDDDPSVFAAGAQPVDAETLARLRSLGYVSGGAVPDQRHVDPKDKIGLFEAFNDGVDAVNEMIIGERWAAAERELRALEEAAPDHFLVLYYAGKVGLARGRVDEAVASLEAALDANPTYSLTFVELSRAYEVKGDVERAVELLLEASRAYPDVFSFPLRLGDLYLRQQRFPEALAAYRTARAMIPSDPTLLSRMAGLFLQQGSPDAAVEVLRTLTEVTPDDPRAWGNLGMVLGGQGQLSGAENAFLRAIEIDPQQAPLHFNLGLVLLRSGRPEEARGAFRRALEIDPSFEPARDQLARLGGARP